MAHQQSGALLLADLVENPSWPKDQHRSSEFLKRDHGLTAPNSKIRALIKSGLIRDKFPNFELIGFKTQAFIDIEITDSQISMDTEEKQSKNIIIELNKIPNIILIYTVFGLVDIRCKVVGVDLRHIESTVMQVRRIQGVKNTTTSIIIDETIYESARNKWALLIKEYKEIVENHFPADSDPNETVASDQEVRTPDTRRGRVVKPSKS